MSSFTAIAFVASMLATVVSSGITIGSLDSNFDPGRITWWKSQWSPSPISSTNDHIGTIDLTFNLRFTTAISNGIIEISGSTAMQTSGDFTVSTNIATAPLTVSDGEETSITLRLLVSTSGFVGPFKILTRHKANGQIVDTNYAFGSVYLASPYTSVSTLVVADTDTSPIATPSHGATMNLSFGFDINYDMWEHDLFIITMPSDFSAISPVCKSLDTDSNTSDAVVVNNLCPTTTDSECELKCEKRGNEIIIYGLNTSVNFVSSLIKAKLSVDGFILPSANFAGSELNWSVKTKRFATNYVYAEYTGTGPSTLVSITEGSISVKNKAHRGLDNSKIFNGMSLYMDFTFITSTDIPSDGTLTATFTGITLGAFPGDSNTECITEYGSCPAADVDSSAATVTFPSGFSPGPLRVTFYVTLDASSATVMVETATSAGKAIDKTTNASISLGDAFSSTERKASYFLVGNYASNTAAAAETKGASEIYFATQIATGTALTSAAILHINCPIDPSSISKTKLYISELNVTWQAKDIADGSSNGFDSDPPNVSSGATSQTVVVSTDSIYIATGNFLGVVAGNSYALGGVATSGNTVRNPMVASNKLTYYECHGYVQEGLVAYNGVATFDVTATDDIISAGVLCANDATEGIPIVVLITANSPYDISDSDYQITITGASSFGLGTTAGTSKGWKVGGSLDVEHTETLMTVSGFGTLTAGTAVNLYLPKGDSAGTGSETIKIVYYEDLVEHILASGFATLDNRAAVNFDSDPTIALIGTPKNVGDSVEISVETYTGAVSADILGLGQIPPWWDLTAAGFTTDAANAVVSTGAIYSSDPDFTGQTVFGISDVKMNTALNKFTGIKITSENEDPLLVYNAMALTVGTINCSGTKTTTIAIDVPDFITKITSPVTTIAKGPRVMNQDVTVTIVPSQPIPNGGSIEITMASFWTIPDGTCTVSGLSPSTTNGSVTCSMSSNVATISTFDEVPIGGSVTLIMSEAYPTSSSAVSSPADCVTSIVSKNKQDKKINESGALTLCTSTDPNQVGKSTFPTNPLFLYPNSSQRRADVYISFSLEYELPAGGIISITAPATFTTDKDKCFSNIIYSACSASGTSILITTAETILPDTVMEFYFDDGMTVGTAGATADFSVSSTYAGEVYTDDSAHSNTLSVTYNAVATDITDGSLTATVKTPGEYSTYNFTYTTPVVFESTDLFWIIFPMSYDPNIGKSTELSNGEWRIQCSSSVFPNIACKVDHWMVIISGLEALAIQSPIDVSIDLVMNPGSLSAATFGWIHMKGDGVTVSSISENFSTITLDASPGYIDLRAVVSSSTVLAAEVTYTFQMYLDAKIEDADQIIASFPDNFLAENDNGETLSCVSKYFDENNDPTNALDVDDTVLSCSVDSNQVKWTASSALANPGVDLDAHDRLELTISLIKNPRWGFSRVIDTNTYPYYDVDTTAINAGLFTSYESWSTHFSVHIYDSSTKTVSFKSFSHRNSAYLGFEDSSSRRVNLQVGNFEPSTMANWISLNVGQMSEEIDLKFSNDVPLLADSLAVQGTASPLSLHLENASSVWAFSLLQDHISFRVSAPTGTASGLYYISFAPSAETYESCHSSVIYGPSPQVLVEVQSSTTPIKVTSEVEVYLNKNSYPVSISLSRAPSSDLTVGLDLGNYASTFNITEAVFSAGETTQYLVLYTSNATTKDYFGTLYINGTDKASYTITSSPLRVTVLRYDPVSTTSITASTDYIGWNNASISLDGGDNGISYISVKCSQSSEGYVRTRTLEEMKANLTSCGQEIYDPSKSDLSFDSTTSFYQYLKDVASQSCSTEILKSASHSVSGGSSYQFEGLMDGQEYLAIAYIETPYESVSNISMRFTTNSTQTMKRYTIVFSSSSDVTATSSSQGIVCELADYLRVPTYYLYAYAPTVTNSASNSSIYISTYVYDLMYNRIDSSNSPAKFAAFFTDVSDLENSLRSSLSFIDTSDNITVSTSDLNEEPAPSIGNTAPMKTENGNNNITFKWTPNNAGQWCVVCPRNTSDSEYFIQPDAKNIPYGLSAGYFQSQYTCVETSAETEATAIVTGLESTALYNCYHAFCSMNKLLPACNALHPSEVTTYRLDSAANLAVFSIILILAVI